MLSLQTRPRSRPSTTNINTLMALILQLEFKRFENSFKNYGWRAVICYKFYTWTPASQSHFIVEQSHILKHNQTFANCRSIGQKVNLVTFASGYAGFGNLVRNHCWSTSLRE
jgi:hypothetical protein